MYPPVVKISVNRTELPLVIKVDGKTFKVGK